jgi:hypothetical protein
MPIAYRYRRSISAEKWAEIGVTLGLDQRSTSD